MQICECSIYLHSYNDLKLFRPLQIRLRPNCHLLQAVFSKPATDQGTRTFLFHDLINFTSRLRASRSFRYGASFKYFMLNTLRFDLYARFLDSFHTIFVWYALWCYLIIDYGIRAKIDDIHWCSLLFPHLRTPLNIL